MVSLKRRAILGGLVWGIATFAVCGVTLMLLFDRMAERRFLSDLEDRQTQMVAAVANSGGDPAALELYMTDPAYARPFSGRYWQVDGPDGTIATSRSLFDSSLDLPTEQDPARRIWTGAGPEGQLRGMVETVELEDSDVRLTLATATSMEALTAERSVARWNVLLAFTLVSIFTVAGATILTSITLRPLAVMREEVRHRWEKGEHLDEDEYPEEVAPLVADINALLARNRDIVDRGRRQAADLAHALKTPSAALRNELNGLPPQVSSASLEALNRIDAQIGRSLARIRASNTHAGGSVRTDAIHAVNRLARLFRAMLRDRPVSLTLDLPDDCTVLMDQQDFEEMLGNLIENATKWCEHRIEISIQPEGDRALIVISDDGPGISEERRKTALKAGERLDTAVPGTGLGLAISNDLAAAYGGEMTLDSSEPLGGLEVRVTVPIAQARTSPVARAS